MLLSIAGSSSWAESDTITYSITSIECKILCVANESFFLWILNCSVSIVELYTAQPGASWLPTNYNTNNAGRWRAGLGSWRERTEGEWKEFVWVFLEHISWIELWEPWHSSWQTPFLPSCQLPVSQHCVLSLPPLPPNEIQSSPIEFRTSAEVFLELTFSARSIPKSLDLAQTPIAIPGSIKFRWGTHTCAHILPYLQPTLLLWNACQGFLRSQ